MTQPPWSTGPSEILHHGLTLLQKDSDSNRRLAMISIDNAVELTIKTYLSLPKRITGINIPRKEFQEVESFPQLLDTLEKYASDKLYGIDLGEIEWFHRLRNQLYHQGNGLTSEKNKVEIYAELAKILFKNLFGFDAQTIEEDEGTDLLKDFLVEWIKLESVLRKISTENPHMFIQERILSVSSIVGKLADDRLIKVNVVDRIKQIEGIRSRVIHGIGDFREQITQDLILEIQSFIKGFNSIQIPELIHETIEITDDKDDIPF